MPSSLNDALLRARIAWRANVTYSDPRSRQKQLHGLYKLLMSKRDELFEILSKQYYTPKRACEIDFAITVKDIATHLKLLEISNTRSVKSPWGLTKVELIASGVVLLSLTESETCTLKSFFGPIAAALAAGNVVVIGKAGPRHALVDLLVRQYEQFLNPNVFYVVNDDDTEHLPLVPVDKLVIIDDQAGESCRPEESPQTRRCHFNTGVNVAILGENQKAWTPLIPHIQSNLQTNKVASEGIHGLFVRDEQKDPFLSQFSDNTTANVAYEGTSSLLDAVPVDETTFQVELKSILQADRDGVADLDTYLEATKQQRCCLIIFYTSFDQVIDALGHTDSKINSFGILGSPSDKVVNYLIEFISSEIFYLEFIPAALPLAAQHCPPTRFISPLEAVTLCPKAIFSRTRTIIAPSKRDTYIHLSTTKIRSSTERLIPDLPPDESGKRLGFFDHVFYAAVGIGSLVVVGIGCAAYYGYRAMSNR